jgi:hypothetical protein
MDFAFFCLLVDDDGEPLGDIFVLRKNGDEFVAELADAIQKRRADNPQIVADHLRLWKPEPFLPASSLPELSGRVKALHLNVTGIEHKAVLLDKYTSIGENLPSLQPLPLHHVHIIAQLSPATSQ